MRFSTQAVPAIVREYFGIDGTASDLNGYDVWNYLIRADDGKKYILKISPLVESEPFLDAQVQIMQFLARTPLADKLQHHIAGVNGNFLVPARIDCKQYHLR
ncbi:MAG: hypothetical protein ACTHMC_25200, partial [Pseudobacter sp.]|uniref:hypothetical protein n=1 Tax=Pseudobacter sp. TaxID=2045420 RepID=UPI003F7F1F64